MQNHELNHELPDNDVQDLPEPELEIAEAEEQSQEAIEIKPVVEEHFDDAIKLYLREVQKTKLLTVEEERALAARIELGDKVARERMIVSNLRLVVKIAKRYMNRGLPFLDLIEEGNMGLIKAVERYQLAKECRFSTYATWWIRQSVERALINQSRTIRLPVHVSEDINKMLRVSYNFIKETNREPSVSEVADTLEVDVAYVRKLMLLLRKTLSIEQPMGEDGDYFLHQTIEDTSAVSPLALIENQEVYTVISRGIEYCTAAEKEILTLRFGLNDEEPQTLEVIGQRYGVSRERIRQIETKVLKKLRAMVESEARIA